MEAVGYEVQLIPPIYVKPFVKQQKNDANDAEAIIEASFRPTMRFVAVKPAELQAHAMVIKRRDLLALQRSQIVNALRRHLMEFGLIAPAGLASVKSLIARIEDPEVDLPPLRSLIGPRPSRPTSSLQRAYRCY